MENCVEFNDSGSESTEQLQLLNDSINDSFSMWRIIGHNHILKYTKQQQHFFFIQLMHWSA